MRGGAPDANDTPEVSGYYPLDLPAGLLAAGAADTGAAAGSAASSASAAAASHGPNTGGLELEPLPSAMTLYIDVTHPMSL